MGPSGCGMCSPGQVLWWLLDFLRQIDFALGLGLGRSRRLGGHSTCGGADLRTSIALFFLDQFHEVLLIERINALVAQKPYGIKVGLRRQPVFLGKSARHAQLTTGQSFTAECLQWPLRPLRLFRL